MGLRARVGSNPTPGALLNRLYILRLNLPEKLRHIVRIAGHDLDGTRSLVHALSRVRGIGVRLAYVIANRLELDPHQPIGQLSDDTLRKLEESVKNVAGLGIPGWLLNRQRDLGTGENKHLIGSDLLLGTKADIDFMKKIKCWKGVRHALGLKVRGQRTRTTSRTGTTVGVHRRKVPGR